MLNSILKLFRKSDPETSQEAAEGAQEFVKKHEELILEIMRGFRTDTNNLGGFTKSECADSIKYIFNYQINDVQVCRRMKKLEEDGKVVRTELKRKNANGHSETVWRLA